MKYEMKQITDTIFADDNAALNLISAIESKEATYKLGTDIQGLDIDCKFSKTDNGNFELSFVLNRDNDFDLEYFFIKPTLLVAQGVNILILNKDVKTINQSFSDKSPEIKCTVELNKFRGDIDDSLWKDAKQAAFFRYKTADFELFKSGIILNITTDKNQNSSLKNGVLLNIDKSQILFYLEKIDEDYGYFIFKTQNNIDFDKFEKVVNAARAALGLISGYYMADSVYYISLKRPKGIKGLTYKYQNINEVIKHNYPLLDKPLYRDIKKEELNLSGEQYNKLVKLLYTHEEFLRASLLLITAGTTKGISKGALASVALETITNIIAEEQPKKKIIGNTEIYSQLKHEINKVLRIIKPRINKEECDVLEKRLNNIYTLPNAKKLEDAFNLLDIELNEEELYCLSCRNKLLHGVLPENKKIKILTEDELIFFVSNRLIMLSSMLLLKKAGFEGKIIDWGFTEVAKRRAIISGQRVKVGNAFRDINNEPNSDGNED